MLDAHIDVIRQYPGQQTADRHVKVMVPGKFFPSLQPSERAVNYEGEAAEYTERRQFRDHVAWGAAHKGPGIRFICNSDAVEDPDNRGFWTPLQLFNRWRHNTYKDDREAEMQYLDDVPGTTAAAAAVAAAAADKPKSEPEVKKHFILLSSAEHTFGGTGRLAGKKATAFYYACRKAGCKCGPSSGRPIKQVGSATGQLFGHLDVCQPELAKQLRAKSVHSPYEYDGDGNIMTLYSFQELLPRHVLYVKKCFLSFDHFYETRADNGLLEWVQSFNERAALPHQQTCDKILAVFEELMDETLQLLIRAHEASFGRPSCGQQADLWSMKSAKATFGCCCGSWVFDGDMLDRVLGLQEYAGKLVDCCPILGFDKFTESRHTGAALARWRSAVNKRFELEVAGTPHSVGLSTEDGARTALPIIKRPTR